MSFDFDLFVIGAGSGCTPPASPPASVPVSRWRRVATWVAPASTSAACRRSCWSMARISARDFEQARAYGWSAGEASSTGRP